MALALGDLFEGIFLENAADGNEIKDNHIENWKFGVKIEGGSNNEIEGNDIATTTADGGDGIFVDEPNNKIEDNTIAGWKVGIHIGGADKNRIEGNSLSANSEDGIRVRGNDNSIEKNLVAPSGSDGNGGYGIKIESGKGNVVKRNTAQLNDMGGILVGTGCEDTRIESNTANESGGAPGHGILVEMGAKDTRIESNTANHNGTGITPPDEPGDGIRILAPETMVKKNIACNNGGFGIFAVPGVDDDGGNKAKGNGNHDQCSIDVVKCSAKTDCQSTLAKLNSDEIPESQAGPEQFTLVQNYPNPFNPETEIRFRLPEASPVVVKIYNLFGQEIRTLVDKTYPAGNHSMRWDGKDNLGKAVSSGVYFYRLQAGSFMQVKKMNLLR